MILAKAPRRFGKSIAGDQMNLFFCKYVDEKKNIVGMIVIAFALVMPGSTQAIFSTGRRASRNLLEICYKHLVDLGLSDREVGFNQENLFIKDPESGKISKIYCYPSNSKVGNVKWLTHTHTISFLLLLIIIDY